jgi:hypothetical protein
MGKSVVVSLSTIALNVSGLRICANRISHFRLHYVPEMIVTKKCPVASEKKKTLTYVR